MSVFDDANNVAFWDFNSAPGGVVSDTLKGTHDITLSGAVINIIDPMVGVGDVFGDGVDDIGIADNSADFDTDGTEPIGLSFWIKPKTLNDTHFSKTSANAGLIGRIVSSKFDLVLSGGGGGGLLVARSSANALINTKHHVVWNYDGSKNGSGVKLYVNGVRRAFTLPLDTLTGSLSNAEDFVILNRSDSGDPAHCNLDAFLPRIGSQFSDGGVAIDAVAGGEVAELWNGGVGLELENGAMGLSIISGLSDSSKILGPPTEGEGLIVRSNDRRFMGETTPGLGLIRGANKKTN